MRFILLTLISGCAAFAADVNLVAKVTSTFEDGATLKRVQFVAEDGSFAVSLDSGTEIEPLADGTRFKFEGLRSATCELRPGPVSKKQPITPENLPAYKAAALAFAPQGAVIPEQPEITEQPLPINSWKSHRVAFEYHLADDPKKILNRISVTFITLENTQQIVLVTKARATEFNAAHARSESLIRSWYPMRNLPTAN
jgi:hypothetical protein